MTPQQADPWLARISIRSNIPLCGIRLTRRERRHVEGRSDTSRELGARLLGLCVSTNSSLSSLTTGAPTSKDNRLLLEISLGQFPIRNFNASLRLLNCLSNHGASQAMNIPATPHRDHKREPVVPSSSGISNLCRGEKHCTLYAKGISSLITQTNKQIKQDNRAICGNRAAI